MALLESHSWFELKSMDNIPIPNLIKANFLNWEGVQGSLVWKYLGIMNLVYVVSSREHLLVLGSGITGLSLKKTPHVWLPHAKKTFYCHNVRF